MDCLGTETVALYVCGALGVAMRARADAHVDRCPACRAWIARAARMAASEGESTTDRELYAPVRPTSGTRLGRYVIRDVVGRGAMGVVLRADDPMLGRPIALKLLHRVAEDESEHRALLGEARKLAQLSDPNVVQVFDVGTWCGRLFLAMELIDGASLRQAIATHEYTRRERLDMLIAAGRGLGAAHAVGIVHRDFKPDNVLVADDPRGRRVLVGDFGLALSTTLDRTEESDVGDEDERIVGTPAYMAPEQRVGGNVDARADQFAFCVTAVEILLGWRPLAIETQRDASLFHARARSLPRPLVRALERGLAAEPARRHRSMDALLLGLERAAPRRGPPLTAALLALGALAWTAMPRHESTPVTPEIVAEIDAVDRVSAGSAHALRSASAMAVRADDPATARTLVDAAIVHAEQSRDSAALVAALVARGKLENAADDEEGAIADLERAHALARRDRLDADAAHAAILLARVIASRPQDGDDALGWLRQAEASASLGSLDAARVASTRARIAIIGGDLETARAEADRALARLADGEVSPGSEVEVLLAAFDDLVARGERIDAAEVFDDLVETWCVAGDCARSSVASRRMLDRLIAELGPDDREVAYARVRLAYHLFSIAALDDAQRELEAAIAVLERDPADPPVVLALAIQRLSHLHYGAGRIALALEYARRAAPLAEQAFGRDSPNFVTAMLQLATVESAAGEIADARRHLEWALIGSEETLGPTHPLTAVVLTQLARLARVQGDHARARSTSLRAMAVHEARGGGSPDYVHAIGLFAWAIAPHDPITAATLLRRQIAVLDEMRESVGNPVVLTRETREARQTLAEVEHRLRVTSG